MSSDAHFNSVKGVTNVADGIFADKIPPVYIVDSTLPTINVKNPQEGGRFTAKAQSAGEAYIDTLKGKRITTADRTFDQNPLKIVPSEELSKIVAQVGKSKGHILDEVKTVEDTVILYDLMGDYNKDGATTVKNDTLTAPPGDDVIVTFTFSDLVGNENTIKVDDVTFDNVPLEISDIFPESDAVEDTVTIETVDVSLTISEDADSISVRWVQYIKDDPKGSILDPKIGIRKDVSEGDVDDIGFTFGDDDINKTFTLQIFARDNAGNVTLTEPDTLFFSDDFVNPVADTFRVTRPTDLPDSSIVGQELTLHIDAFDRSRGEDGKIAVTYPDKEKGQGDVLVSVLVPNEDPEMEMTHVLAAPGRFTISENGDVIEQNSDGTVTLNDKGWDLGERTITVTTRIPASMVIVTVEDTSTLSGTDQETLRTNDDEKGGHRRRAG